jgi:hypothetical protein
MPSHPARRSDAHAPRRRGVPPLLGPLLALLLLPAPAGAFEDHVFVATGRPGTGSGSCASLSIQSPWSEQVDLVALDPDAVVRHFFGRHFAVNRSSGEIVVIDPATFAVELRFSVGAGSTPHDILLVDERTAWVSRFDSSLLYQVDPTTGALLGTVDLGPLADADGLPEMSMMARDGDRLFVQVQRLDRDNSDDPVAPSYLAVIDLSTGQLIDVDPVEPGVQGIALTGLVPQLKMHVEPDRRRLYVSTPGRWHDSAGGIDEVDLDRLQALGFVATEAEFALQMGPFAMVSETKGYLITHTDIAISSHLAAFSRIDGSRLATPWDQVGVKVESLAFDPVSEQLFVPCPHPLGEDGVVVIDAVSDAVLTPDPVGVGLPPNDLLVARGEPTPGEARDLRVRVADPASAGLVLTYQPACASADHVIVLGPLDSVSSGAYSSQVCGIGSDGTHGPFDPGPGSWFLLVVGNDGAGVEGSYGTDSLGQERPEDLLDPSCAFTQDLSGRCD